MTTNTETTQSKGCAHQLDTKVIFKVSRDKKDLLAITFYNVIGLPLATFSGITVEKIDGVVSAFRPECEKMQILAYPNEEWFKDGCPETKYARVIS